MNSKQYNESVESFHKGISAMTLEEFNNTFTNVTISHIDGDIIYINASVGNGRNIGNVTHKGVFITDKDQDNAVLSILMSSATVIDKVPATLLLCEIKNIELIKAPYWRIEFTDNQLRSYNNTCIVRFEPKTAIEVRSDLDQITAAIATAANNVKGKVINNIARYRRAMEHADIRIGTQHGVEENTIEYTFDNGIVVTESVTTSNTFAGIGINRKVESHNDSNFKHHFHEELSFYEFIGKHI